MEVAEVIRDENKYGKLEINTINSNRLEINTINSNRLAAKA